MFCLAGFFVWVSRVSVHTGYLEIAGQMVLGGSGVGLVSAPATEAIMGVVTKAKAGISSAVNDATRLLAAARHRVTGSVYARSTATMSPVGYPRRWLRTWRVLRGLGRRRPPRCLQP